MAELVLWLNMYHKLVSALLAAMLAIIPLSGKLSGRIFLYPYNLDAAKGAIQCVPDKSTDAGIYVFMFGSSYSFIDFVWYGALQ